MKLYIIVHILSLLSLLGGLDKLEKDCLIERSITLNSILESNNIDLEIIDVTDSEQLKFNSKTNKFEEFDNNLFENTKAYIYFNKEDLEFNFIGFYLEHDLIWDTHTIEFVHKWQLKRGSNCAEKEKVLLQIIPAKMAKLNKRKPKLEPSEIKCEFLKFLEQVIKSDCSEISWHNLAVELDFDVVPLKDLKLQDHKK